MLWIVARSWASIVPPRSPRRMAARVAGAASHDVCAHRRASSHSLRLRLSRVAAGPHRRGRRTTRSGPRRGVLLQLFRPHIHTHTHTHTHTRTQTRSSRSTSLSTRSAPSLPGIRPLSWLFGLCRAVLNLTLSHSRHSRVLLSTRRTRDQRHGGRHSGVSAATHQRRRPSRSLPAPAHVLASFAVRGWPGLSRTAAARAASSVAPSDSEAEMGTAASQRGANYGAV